MAEWFIHTLDLDFNCNILHQKSHISRAFLNCWVIVFKKLQVSLYLAQFQKIENNIMSKSKGSDLGFFWRSVGEFPSQMHQVSFITGDLVEWYSTRNFFQVLFPEFHLQGANVYIQVLNLCCPCSGNGISKWINNVRFIRHVVEWCQYMCKINLRNQVTEENQQIVVSDYILIKKEI